MSTSRQSDSTLRIVVIVLATIVLAPMFMMLLAFPMFGMWGGMMGGFGGTEVTPMWGVGMALVWLIVLLTGGYLVYRWLSSEAAAPTDPALDELRLVYARGDLSAEEFEERRANLGGE